jgi:hypothetical protein
VKRKYEKVVRELGVQTRYLDEQEKAILGRLKTALVYIQGKSDVGDRHTCQRVFGLNQCLCLATTIVLLTSTIQKISKVREGLAKTARHVGTDSATLISIACLAAILDWAQDQKDSGWVNEIRSCFEEVNWLIGSEGAYILGLEE